jgi:hypothetical protein
MGVGKREMGAARLLLACALALVSCHSTAAFLIPMAVLPGGPARSLRRGIFTLQASGEGPSAGVARRELLKSLLTSPMLMLRTSSAVMLAPALQPLPCVAADGDSPEQQARTLLSGIPAMAFGAPATDATVAAELAAGIEAHASALEQRGGKDQARSAQLAGSWRLLYSNAREIRNLASGLPLGFALGKVYQPLDPATGRFENQASIEHMYGLARGGNSVIGDVRVAPMGTVNAAGTVNNAGNRVEVDFRRITFTLEQFLGQPVRVRKIIVAKQSADAAPPANDITYLDDSVRITRGGDDSLFIFCREPGERPMLSASERLELYAEGGKEATLFGKTEDGTESAPPELRKLIE